MIPFLQPVATFWTAPMPADNFWLIVLDYFALWIGLAVIGQCVLFVIGEAAWRVARMFPANTLLLGHCHIVLVGMGPMSMADLAKQNLIRDNHTLPLLKIFLLVYRKNLLWVPDNPFDFQSTKGKCEAPDPGTPDGWAATSIATLWLRDIRETSMAARYTTRVR